MHPIICKIGPFTVYSYGLMLVAAFLAGTMLAADYAKRRNLPQDTVFNLSFGAFVSGIVGARLLYIIGSFSYYLENPLEIIMLQHGGLSWFGGLAAGVAFAIVYLKKNRLPIYGTFDLLAPFIALGQAIGRIGCLLNGCCFGRESEEFGLYFTAHEARLIPTQLYSSLFLVAIFIVLRILQERPHKEGQIFFTYLALYSAKRFFVEFWRADHRIIIMGLSPFQLISLAVFLVSFIKLILIRRTRS